MVFVRSCYDLYGTLLGGDGEPRYPGENSTAPNLAVAAAPRQWDRINLPKPEKTKKKSLVVQFRKMEEKRI